MCNCPELSRKQQAVCRCSSPRSSPWKHCSVLPQSCTLSWQSCTRVLTKSEERITIQGVLTSRHFNQHAAFLPKGRAVPPQNIRYSMYRPYLDAAENCTNMRQISVTLHRHIRNRLMQVINIVLSNLSSHATCSATERKKLDHLGQGLDRCWVSTRSVASKVHGCNLCT
jgi:hypothetical protein